MDQAAESVNAATVPRYQPQRDLPPYTYVPGRAPHPVTDPGGHSYGRAITCVAVLGSSTFRDCPEYLYGVDLFNSGYYWEAHEVWEAVWIAAGRRGAAADFLKGLIKLAAAGVKCREGRQAGVRRHARRASELFSAAQQSVRGETYLGLRFDELLQDCEVAASTGVNPATDGLPQVVFPFRLLPR